MVLSSEMKKVVLQHIRELKEIEGTQVKEEWLEDRAVLSAIRNARMVECVFIESSRSCAQARRMDEYYDVLEQGIKLNIVVPQAWLSKEIARMKRVKGEGRFAITGYGEEIKTQPMI